jgi:outer membrane lipoprotein SlyB
MNPNASAPQAVRLVASNTAVRGPATWSPWVWLAGATGLVAAGAVATAAVLNQPTTAPQAASVTGPTTTPSSAKALAAPVEAPARSAAATTRVATTPQAAIPAGATAQSQQAQPAAPACATCGVVEQVTPFEQKGEGTGVGAVAGGVIGGVLGSQVGGGSGQKAMTVIGAVGGGMAGHEMEKRQRATTLYRVRVRMDDGTVRTVTQGAVVGVGQRVTVDQGRARSMPGEG